jgi:P pilus assembly chaperone PapD
MLTYVSVPVFVEPLKAQPVLSVSTARIEGRQLVVNFNNSGNARVDPHQLALRVLDNKRGEIFHNEQLFGYILPGSSMALKLDMPAPACAQAKSLTVQLEGLPALPEHDIGRGAGACDARSSH